ncbi:putative membrane protein SpoIIM required for sporulation [Halorubrum alkaliphilum]|uniref:Putative membrane protein SpoIIM required for sporulation n=1 Tax=Halorubrum alkaliphilum TaxID=261290 RepID=A0A8T4GK47_9EURY|nr:stage II sporulation protein M [Halorubrum alkaliphilum]MBP1923385.1 putative membrane protein SpoIIM required for sporulation [Halorubrum alkaliphilum]
MDLSTAVTATVSTLRRRPADLLPFYLLGTAVPVIARLGLLVALGGVYLHFELSGRLGEVRDTLAGVDLTPPDAENPEAIEQWAEGLLPAFEPLFSLTAGLLLVTGVIATVLLAILAYAAISAGQMSAVVARLRDERGLTAGIAGTRDRWLTFLGLYLAEFLLWVGVLLLASLVVGVAFVVNPFLGAIVALGAFLLGAVVLVAVRIVFAFAPAAIVVDDAGVLGAVDGAGGFIRSNPADAAAYLVVAVGVVVAIASAASALAFLGGGAVVALVSAVVVAPALDLLKTVLYGDYRGTVDPVGPPEASLRGQFTGGIRRGWRAMVGFVFRTPGTHLFVVALGVGSGALGWMLAEPFVGAVPTSIEARLADHIAPVATLEFFGNNWSVAISTAFGGVALVIPALSAIVFNGVVLGGVAALEVNLPALVAFVVPHGIFEIPAIFIAGALGVHLGRVSWRTFRGRLSREGFADVLENAFWVAMGLGILLAIAAVIEGFISPYYWQPFL